jgi:F-type H+-transporting ATPase subunit b
MLIDWFTVGAQALNFLVLVWLMKRFLYKPVLHAIDEREKRIAGELAAAANTKAAADKERDALKQEHEDLDHQRATILKQATDAAEAERHRLLDAAGQAADALSAKRQEALSAEAQSLGQAVRRRTEQEVFAIARKTLADLATTSLEERLGDVFTRHLREISGKEKSGLADALKTAPPGVVRSAFELPPKERATIQNALNETFSADVRVRFETAPNLICGIELTASGLKTGWSIESYLASLEEGVVELLKERANEKEKAKVAAAPKPEVKETAKPDAKETPTLEAKETPRPAVKETPKLEAKETPKPAANGTPKPAAPAAQGSKA